MRAEIKPGTAFPDYELCSTKASCNRGGDETRGFCRMVRITTTDPREALNYRNGIGAQWPFLADHGRIVRRELDMSSTRPRPQSDGSAHDRV